MLLIKNHLGGYLSWFSKVCKNVGKNPSSLTPDVKSTTLVKWQWNCKKFAHTLSFVPVTPYQNLRSFFSIDFALGFL